LFFCKIVEDQGVFFVKNGNRGVFFCKKSGKWGVFFCRIKVDLSSTQDALFTVSLFFKFYIYFAYLGGAYAPPPAYGPTFFSAQIGILDGHFSINCVSFTYFIRFRYFDHLDANRMAPTVCPDPIERNNVVGFKQFCTPYFRRIFGTCL